MSSLGQGRAGVTGCQPLTDVEKARLTGYVANRYQIPASVKLAMKEATVQATNCYYKLTFGGVGPLGPIELTLYLSPDHRFLSPELYDSQLDPQKEARAAAESYMQELTRGSYAYRGPEDAPVTVVVFSDFQCPYCRQMADALRNEPRIQAGRQVKIIFRHLPLPTHNWAREAAQAAACAQFQNQSAFWQVHDFLFAEQETLTLENLRPRVLDFSKGLTDLDQKMFRTCIENQMALGTVLKDINVAAIAEIKGTPTVVINGRRLEGLRSATELHTAIEEVLIGRGRR